MCAFGPHSEIAGDAEAQGHIGHKRCEKQKGCS